MTCWRSRTCASSASTSVASYSIQPGRTDRARPHTTEEDTCEERVNFNRACLLKGHAHAQLFPLLLTCIAQAARVGIVAMPLAIAIVFRWLWRHKLVPY